MTLRSGYNLPPGVFASDLPGNMPADRRYDAIDIEAERRLAEHLRNGTLEALYDELTDSQQRRYHGHVAGMLSRNSIESRVAEAHLRLMLESRLRAIISEEE